MRNLIGGLSRLPQVTKDVIRVNVNTKSKAEHCDKTPGHNNLAVPNSLTGLKGATKINNNFLGEKRVSDPDVESISFKNYLKNLM
jgi:hypothetical protein